MARSSFPPAPLLLLPLVPSSMMSSSTTTTVTSLVSFAALLARGALGQTVVALDDVDVEALHASFGWANEIASLVQRTYVTGLKTLEAIAERKSGLDVYGAWEILNWEDPLPACAKAYCKQYARLPSKRPPFHVGCDCQLENIVKD